MGEDIPVATKEMYYALRKYKNKSHGEDGGGIQGIKGKISFTKNSF